MAEKESIGVLRQPYRSTPIGSLELRDICAPIGYKAHMERRTTDWRDGLATDLFGIYKDGLRKKIEPESAPVLAELAVALSSETYRGESDYYSLQIEDLLRKAFRRLEKTKERQGGLETLFGIVGDNNEDNDENVLGLEQRRDEAAPFFGYKDKDTLRHGEVSRRPFEEVIRERLLHHMLAIADEQHFEYTARYGDLRPSDKVEDDLPQGSSPNQAETSGDAESTTDRTQDAEPEPMGEPPTNVVASDLTNPPASLRWWRRRVLQIFGVLVIVLLVGGVVFLVTGDSHSTKYVDAWGPKRYAYDYRRYDGNNNCADPANPAAYYGRCGAMTTYPVFNSFIYTPSYGDEFDFFEGYRAEQPNGNASDPIRNVTNGNKIIVLRIYVDNMAQVYGSEPELTTAYNTRVRVYLPSNTDTSLVAYAYISADRAITVSDTADLTSRTPFSLEYIPGSAVLIRTINDRTYNLSDEIIGSDGAPIGVKIMNGVLPPSNNFSTTAWVELKVRAVPQTSSP